MSDKIILDHFHGVVSIDFFRMFCGDELGGGVGRKVHTCRIDPTLVVKIETGHQSFQNIMEWETWCQIRETRHVARWFAPCVDISAAGTVLLMKRTEPVPKAKFPVKIPAFLTDTKLDNYGLLNGKVVCHDYGFTRLMDFGTTKRMVKAEWWKVGD